MEKDPNLQQALIGFAIIIILFLIAARIETIFNTLY